MELNVGPEQPLPGVGDHATVLTQVNTYNLYQVQARKLDPKPSTPKKFRMTHTHANKL